MSVPDYLVLLHLNGKEVQVVLRQIRDNMRASANQNDYVRRRFKYSDWRGHLISATAMLLAEGHTNLPVTDLWSAFDSGSWVAPQLAATASLVDKEFVQLARRRIEALCPVTMPEGLSALERHVATGPAGQYDRRCKALSSLLTSLKTFPDQLQWIELVSQLGDVETMMNDDIDHGGEIAKHWIASAVRQFREFGITLEPATQQTVGPERG